MTFRSGRPDPATAIPDAVLRWAGHRPPLPIWRNETGGLTYRLGADGVDPSAGDRFIKWTPVTSGVDLTAEIRRLRWASAFSTVPHVLHDGADGDGSWFVTAALPGRSAVDDRWLAEPAMAVAAIGRGLRDLHDALPVDGCPFDWSAQSRVTLAHRLSGSSGLNPAGWHQDHQHFDVPAALDELARPPAIDRLVVCHGDACAPNTLIDDDGRCAGHVDLGALGVADRWADLAVATWSAEWNFGPGWESTLLDAYGVAADPVRTAYYRLLWDLGP